MSKLNDVEQCERCCIVDIDEVEKLTEDIDTLILEKDQLTAELNQAKAELQAWKDRYPKMRDEIRENFTARLEAQVAELKGALEKVKNSEVYLANELEKLCFKMYGDLHGCDCEGGCKCKPDSWVMLQQLKYHCLGSCIGIDEVLTTDQKE